MSIALQQVKIDIIATLSYGSLSAVFKSKDTYISHQSEWPSLTSQQITNAGRGCGEQGALLHCWWKGKLVQPLWKTVWWYLRKLNIKLQYDPAIPLVDIYPDKTFIKKDTCTLMFIAKTWKQRK